MAGSRLTVGTDNRVLAGAPLIQADFLGPPLNAMPEDEYPNRAFNLWFFPEVSLTIFSLAQDHVNWIQIENPEPPN